MKILLFGDIHGKFEAAGKHYDAIMQTYKPDIDLFAQVGDFGFWPRLANDTPWLKKFPHRCAFIDGNHEDHHILSLIRQGKLDEVEEQCDPQWDLWSKFLKIWEYKPRGYIENGILFVGGARTVNTKLQRKGFSWFPEENISHREQAQIFEAVEDYGPDKIHTVISHDCPGSFDVQEACSYSGVEIVDQNRKFLESLRQYVRPYRWYFGHYHQKMTGYVENTKWRCLDRIYEKGVNDFVIVKLPDVGE